jgi:hypothetical protein
VEPQAAVAGLEGHQVPRPAEAGGGDPHPLAVRDLRGHAAPANGHLHRAFAGQVAQGLEDLRAEGLRGVHGGVQYRTAGQPPGNGSPCRRCAGGSQVTATRKERSAWPQR